MSGQAFAADKDGCRDCLSLGFVEGQRAAWRAQLSRALGELRAFETPDDAETRLARLVLELDEARRALRSVCAVYGDNDWPDGLNLHDVIEKHLHRHLDEAQGD